LYVAVKVAKRAIENAHGWLARNGPVSVRAGTGLWRKIREQMALAVNRVMRKASLYDADLAAACDQAKARAI